MPEYSLIPKSYLFIITYLLSNNDDRQPSTVVSNQLPCELVILLSHNHGYVATQITKYIAPSNGSVAILLHKCCITCRK